MTNPRLEELRAKFQENPRRYFAPYANELRKTGDPASAIAVCRTHLASQPGHVSGHIVLGQALYEAGEANEARGIFTTALELDPENLIALRSLGEIAQVNGDFSAARQWYQRLLDADPRNGEVAQLLRDIPVDAPAKPIFTPEPEPADEPTPFTIREDIAAAEAPPAYVPESPVADSAPRVHTGFTGQGPAYKTEEDEREETAAKQADEAPLSETEDAFIDLQPSAHDHGTSEIDEGSDVVSASTESEPMDMVDIGEETEVFAAEATQEAMPDDSFDFVEASAPDVAPESSFDPVSGYVSETSYDEEPIATPEAGMEPEAGLETVETYTTQSASEAIPALEIEDFAADALAPDSSTESAPADESSEPPRAMFAERGFDGSVDEMGWMTTPSQAFSDLEAAPEDWLEETREETTPAAEAEPSVAASAPEDPATDSWFDEVPGATAIEATEVTSDELWLPPELPQVTNVEANSQTREASEEPAEAASDAPAWSSAAAEEHAVDATPNAAESEWAPSSEAVAPAEETEATETSESSYAQAEASYMPDEAEPAYDSQAVSENFGVNASVVEEESYPVEVSASAAEPQLGAQAEPSEYQEHDVDEAPEFVYASESQTPASGSAIGQTPTDAISPPTPAPFLTETLAELYLQQGFRDEALSIYRQLLDRSPTDETLKSRIAALQQAEVPPPAPVPAESRAGSQSVRTFFSRLARRSATVPPAADSPVGGGSGGEGGAQSDVPFSVAASALANLFSASKPPQADEGAASTLAGAFTDPAGRPSRAAERELSLDHLFRDVAPGGPATGGVTLDEFYSAPNSGTGSSTESGSDAGAEDPSGTDIRQFTAWLEGLRKK